MGPQFNIQEENDERFAFQNKGISNKHPSSTDGDQLSCG